MGLAYGMHGELKMHANFD